MRKVLILPLLSVVLLVTMMSLGSAATAVFTPTAGQNITGTFLINCTYVNGSDATSPQSANTTFYYKTSSGSWTAFTTVTSFSAKATEVTATLTTADVASASEGVLSLNCSLGNVTLQQNASAVVASVTLDDTVPVMSIKQTVTGVTFGSPIDYKCTDNVGLGLPGTFTMTYPTGHPLGTLKALTKSSADYVQTSDLDTRYKGTYTFACIDYTGNAAASQTVKVDAPGSARTTGTSGIVTSGNENFIQKNAIYILIGLGIALWWFSTKK